MRFVIDDQSGTKNTPKRPELTSKKNVVVITAFCDGELEAIQSLAQQAVAKARASLQTSEMSPSLIKYAYVFHKADVEAQQFVRYTLRVGSTVDGEPVYGKQGTDAYEPFFSQVAFGDNENVIVAVVFCDGENQLTSGDAESAQGQVCGAFQRAGVSLSSCRQQYVVEPLESGDSFVEFSVKQGVIEE